jgi:DNA polymerase-1
MPKTKSVTIPAAPTTQACDYKTWGVEANGAALFVNSTLVHTIGTNWVVDVENNLDGSCAGIGLTTDGEKILFFTADVVNRWDRDIFKDVKLVGHNIKYDVQMLRKWGFNVSTDQIVWDTQLAEYVRDSTRFRFGLKPLVTEYFGVSYPDYKAVAGTGKKAKSIGECDPVTVANYCGCDVLFTHRLWTKQLKELTDDQVNYLNDIELPTSRVLLEMEERGVQIDTNHIRNLDNGFAVGIERVVAGIRSVSSPEVNLNSPQQVKQLLLDKAGLRLDSTGAEVLKDHTDIPLVKDLLRYRELSKLRSTYTDVLLKRHYTQKSLTQIDPLAKALYGLIHDLKDATESYRLHARFNQTATDTGRLSSSDPNLQNIPTRTEEGDSIRKGFVARPGHVMVDADYSQIEPRLMAHLSGDKALRAVFLEGRDLYDSVAALVGCDRKTAKILWLAMAYNAGAYKISQTANIRRSEAEVFLTRMKLAFPEFFYWRSRVIAQAEIDG